MRLIAIGHRSLMDGFGLLGMEVFTDPSSEEVENLLSNISRAKEKAMIFLQQGLVSEDMPILQHLRNEGGEILISEIPDIMAVDEYEAPVDHLIKRVLGANFDFGESGDE